MVVSLLVTYTCLICSEKLLKMKCIYNFFACNILLFVFVFVWANVCSTRMCFKLFLPQL